MSRCSWNVVPLSSRALVGVPGQTAVAASISIQRATGIRMLVQQVAGDVVAEGAPPAWA